MFIDNFLISSIICHGFLDFFILAKEKNFIPSYVFGAIIYNSFLKLNQNFFLVFFILFSGYHFGKDFQIISNDYRGEIIWNGFLIISSTLTCKDGFPFWFQFLDFLDTDYENIYIILRLVETLFFFSLFCSLVLSNLKINIFNILRLLIIREISVEYCLMLHMAIVHVPVAIYQFVEHFGKITIIFWLVTTFLMTLILENYQIIINKEILTSSISITIPHMITISIWQLF